MGQVHSRVGLVNLSGRAVEWVREDSSNLLQFSIDDVSNQADGDNRLFELQNQHIVGVDKVTKEVIDLSSSDTAAITAYVDGVPVSVVEISPGEGLVLLSQAPAEGALVKIAYNWLNLAPVGVYGIEVTSPTTFVVDPLIYREPFVVNTTNFRKAKIYLSQGLGLSIFTDLEVRVDGVAVSSDLYDLDIAHRTLTFKVKLQGTNLALWRVSTDTVLQSGSDYFIVKRSASEVLKRRTSGVESVLDLANTSIVPGTLEVYVDEEKLYNYADSFSDAYSPDKITFTLVDSYKVTFSKKLPPSLRVTASYYYYDQTENDYVALNDLFDGSVRLMLPDSGILAKSIEVWIKKDLLSSEDFTFDAETNDLVLNVLPPDNADLKVSYYYALDSEGPYTIEPYAANNQAIKGCVLNFAKQAETGGRQLVFVSSEAEPTAHEYGGKFRVTFTLDIVALDPIQQEEITDLSAMYLLALKERFDSEGLVLDEISIQGEAEEPYDENTTDQYYMASVGVTFLTDWHIRKPIPIKIRDVHLKFIAVAYTDDYQLPVFEAATLFPVVYSPILRSERIV